MHIDYLLSAVVACSSLISYFTTIWKDSQPAPLLAFVIALGFIIHLSGVLQPYYGTEYEDAYVFQADSMDLLEHEVRADSFRIQVSNYDLHSSTDQLYSYNGHFTSFSSLVGTFNWVFGYSATSTILLNFIFTLLIFVVVSDIVYRVTKTPIYAVFATMLLCSNPALNVFHTSGLSETYSTLCLTITFSLAIRLYLDGQNTKILTLMAFIMALAACLMVKRENMVILMTVPFVALPLKMHTRIELGAITLILFSLYLLFVQPFSTEYLEADFISAPTFSFVYLASQAPVYLLTFLNPHYFGLTFWVFIASTIFLAFNPKKMNLISAISILLFIIFLLTYCLHYRSQFFIDSLTIGPFETFRYSNNFFVFAVIATALNLRSIENLLNNPKPFRYIIAGSLAILVATAVLLTASLRSRFYEEEQARRISPAMDIMDYFKRTGSKMEFPTLVTNIPIVFLMYEDARTILRISEFDTRKSYMPTDIPTNTYFYFTNEEYFEGLGNLCELEAVEPSIDYLKHCVSF